VDILIIKIENSLGLIKKNKKKTDGHWKIMPSSRVTIDYIICGNIY
jgi:hypothetical protein